MRTAAAAVAAGDVAQMPPPPRVTGLPNRPRYASSIDYNKYKTKLCRNYLMGVPCPFEHRCVFAHGEDQIPAHTGSEAGFDAPQSPSSAYAGGMDFPMQYAALHNTSGSDDEVSLHPPTYETFIANTMIVETASPIDSDPASPVSPIRYRHDPYHPDGYVLKYY